MYDSKHRTTDTQNYDSRKNSSGYSVRWILWYFDRKTKQRFFISIDFSPTNEIGIHKHMEIMKIRQIIENICEFNVNLLPCKKRIVIILLNLASSNNRVSSNSQQQRENGEKKSVKDVC